MSKIKHSLEETFDYYTVFEDNQVLTSNQLNEVVEYLDDQNKLTRVHLLGLGIICGLIPAYANNKITISKGCAVTTDGDLLYFTENMAYTKFRTFRDKNAEYDHFKVNDKQINITELFTEDSNVPGLDNMDKISADLINKGVVILYNESHLHDPDICTGCDCDNVGRIRYNKLKALLVLEDDYEKIAKVIPSLASCISSFQTLKAKRVIMNDKSIRTLKQLSDAYTTAVDNSVKEISRLLKSGFSSCTSIFTEIWEGSYPFEKWNEIISNTYSTVKGSRKDFQYFYDFLKDFICGLNEFIDELRNVNTFCSFNYSLFPKHVCLGGFKNLAPFNFEKNRTGLYPSPVGSKSNLKKLQFMLIRLHRMVINLNVTVNSNLITILPEKKCCNKFNEKVVPVYYTYNTSNTIYDFWNYNYYEQKRSKEQLSFHSEKYSDNDFILNPLNYEHDDCGLYRIGGHIGWDVDKAETEINAQIKKYNLPFMVMSLQVENTLTTIPVRPSRRFRDVRILHKTYRQDLSRNLTNLSQFNERLVKSVQEAEEKPPTVSKDPKNRFKDYSVDKINNLGEKIVQLKSNLIKRTTDFNYTNFAKDYKTAVTNASTVNKTIRGVTFTDTNTPYDLIMNQSKLNTLKWLDDIIVKEVEKSKELSTLQKFLEENPGMEHYAGVPCGGTFMLVYSSSDKKVIADFALPYWYCECAKDEEVEETVEEEDDPIKWPDFNDVVVDFDRSFGIADKLKIVEDDFTLEKGKVSGQFLNITNNMISKDEIDTKIDKKLTDKETIINNRIDQKLSEKETSITNLFNARISEKEANLNAKLSEKEISMRSDFDSRLSSKESTINASVNDKIDQINTRFSENQEIFTLYAENFGTLINTTSNSIQKIGTTDISAGALGDIGGRLNIGDAQLLNIAETMDAASKLVKDGNAKRGAGTLSAAETRNLSVIEGTASDAIVEAINAVASKETDISKGSDEEKLLNMAIANMDNLSASAKANVVKKVNKIKSGITGKRELSNMLSKIK